MTTKQNFQPGNAAEFHTRQDDVFGRIAGRYDLLCDLFSFGIHRLWKRRVAAVIAKEPWSQLLDCASGTGDIILRVLKSKNLQAGPNRDCLGYKPADACDRAQALERYPYIARIPRARCVLHAKRSPIKHRLVFNLSGLKNL